jgi:hypothetical protein
MNGLNKFIFKTSFLSISICFKSKREVKKNIAHIFFKKLENRRSTLFFEEYKVFIIILAICFVFLEAFSLKSWAQAPVVTSVNPMKGHKNVETFITISGDNFANGANVSLFGKPIIINSCIENFHSCGIFVEGDYAYLGSFHFGINGGLRIIDISNKEHSFEVGFYDTPDWTYDVAIKGNYAYVAAGMGKTGLRIIDITDKTHPFEVGFYNPPDVLGVPFGVYVLGDYAYVAAGTHGLRIIDITDKAHPFEVGFYDPKGMSHGVYHDVYVLENYAYVAATVDGLRIIDVTDKAHPFEVGFYDNTLDYAKNLYISEDYAYVANSCYGPNDGLRIINITDKAHPFEVGFYNMPGQANDVYISGDYAYVTDYGKGLRVINISDKVHPFEVGFCDTPKYPKGVHVSEDYAYVVDGGYCIKIIQFNHQCANVSILDPQTITASIQTGLPVGIYDVLVTNPDGKKGILPGGFEVLLINHAPIIEKVNNISVVKGESISITVPVGETVTMSPQAIDEDPGDTLTFTYSGWMSTNERTADYNDIGSHSVTITATDSHNFSDSVTVTIEVIMIPIITSIHPDEGYNDEETAIIISGKYFDDGAKVSLVGKPNLVSSIDYIYPKDVFVNGDYAYLPVGRTLKIIDISDKKRPIEVGSYKVPGTPKDVYVVGNNAYLVVHTDSIFLGYGCCGPVYISDHSLFIINISNKKQPYEVGSYTRSISDAANLKIRTVVGDYMYLMEIICGSGPEPPFPMPDYVPIETLYEGVRIIDISDKNNPHAVGEYIPPSRADDLYVLGDYIYVVTTNDVLRIIDIYDKANPIEVGFYDDLYWPVAIYVSENYAYVADVNQLRIIDIIDKTQPFEVGTYRPSQGGVVRVQVLGDYAYLFGGGVLRIVNINDKTHPYELSHYDTPPATKHVYVSDYYAYIVHDKGLEIVNLANRECTNVSVVDPQTITATVPAGLIKGDYNVVVTNPGGLSGSLPEGFTALIYDIIPPDIICPNKITFQTTGGPKKVKYPVITVTDNIDSYPMVTFDPPADFQFPIGKTTVTVTATDAAGNSSECSFIVKINKKAWGLTPFSYILGDIYSIDSFGFNNFYRSRILPDYGSFGFGYFLVPPIFSGSYIPSVFGFGSGYHSFIPSFNSGYSSFMPNFVSEYNSLSLDSLIGKYNIYNMFIFDTLLLCLPLDYYQWENI